MNSGVISHSQRVQELIDTLWNVNEGAYILALSGHVRINRYIMECKLYR